MEKSIKSIVEKHLTDASDAYLGEIVEHGIHNLTNDFNGVSNEEYRDYAHEFIAQAREALMSRESQ